MNWETGLFRAGWHLGRAGSCRDKPGADGADVKRTFFQPLFQDLAFQLARGVRLDMVLEALFRGPDLCASLPCREGQQVSESKWRRGEGREAEERGGGASKDEGKDGERVKVAARVCPFVRG